MNTTSFEKLEAHLRTLSNQKLIEICKATGRSGYSRKRNKRSYIQFILIHFFPRISENIDVSRRAIQELFDKNLKGKSYTKRKENHDGHEGHLVERIMGITPNNMNGPDLHQIELKKDTRKTTFGDYMASEYAFSKNLTFVDSRFSGFTRKDFIKVFGSPNKGKHGRLSWSGKCCPSYLGVPSVNGQTLHINDNKDLIIYYNYNYDQRINKFEILPSFLKSGDDFVIAIWKKEKMKKHIEDKFGIHGTAFLKKTGNTYTHVCYYRPIRYDDFLEGLRRHEIIFDSGMYNGNTRHYSQWRTSHNNIFWNRYFVHAST